MKSYRLYRMGYHPMAAPALENEAMGRTEENDEENYTGTRFVNLLDDRSSDDNINDVLGTGDGVNSDQAVCGNDLGDEPGGLGLGSDPRSSVQSLSTATRTAITPEIQTLPLHMPNFKPAADCIEASNPTVVRFLARMRRGIKVLKHGRSRWCKSRERVLKIRNDNPTLTLTWEPAQDEPRRFPKRRPPRLDLTTCREVRHARSEDPDHTSYKGTPILRKKCAPDKIRKSFALIFPERTVDITSQTEDQCKLLTQGFSALCYRLQVANNNRNSAGDNGAAMNGMGHRSIPKEEDNRNFTNKTILSVFQDL